VILIDCYQVLSWPASYQDYPFLHESAQSRDSTLPRLIQMRYSADAAAHTYCPHDTRPSCNGREELGLPWIFLSYSWSAGGMCRGKERQYYYYCVWMTRDETSFEFPMLSSNIPIPSYRGPTTRIIVCKPWWLDPANGPVSSCLKVESFSWCFTSVRLSFHAYHWSSKRSWVLLVTTSSSLLEYRLSASTNLVSNVSSFELGLTLFEFVAQTLGNST